MSTDSMGLPKPAIDINDDNIDLVATLLVILRGWKVIVFFALLGLIIGVLYSRYVNPTFRSDALIQIDKKSKGISALGENISGLIDSEISEAQTEAELIKSRMILEPVVNLLHLDIRLSDNEVQAADRITSNRTQTQVNMPKGVVLKTADGQAQVSNFDVSQTYLNQTFSLQRSDDKLGFTLSQGAETFDGQLGAAHRFKAVNGNIQITVNDLPVDHTLSITKQSLQSTTDSINGALSVVEKGTQTGIIELSMTGDNQQQVSLILKEIVLSYIDQNQSRGSEETTKTLSFMETQIPALKKKLEASESVFNEFREEYGTIDVSKEAELLLIESSQIDVQLNELKLKKADLTTYYTAEHPLVIQINEQLKVLNDRKKEINSTIKGLPEIQREFLKLSEDTAIDREIYLTMLKNYEQLKIVKAGQIGYARIIDLPISTFNAIAPKKFLILLITILSGAMVGTILVLLHNLLRYTVKDSERIEAKIGVPVIASIPRSNALTHLSKNKKSHDRLLAYVDHDSLSYEAIKSLRTYLMFGMLKPKSDTAEQQAKVILISGESPGVGKSFIAANLTEVFSQLNKKVLIIDADMRLGELHKIFAITEQIGLADYFSQHFTDIASITHATTIDNIDFIPRGQQPYNPSSLLASDKFGALMAQLIASYDYIIIDSPPALAASDALILSQYADKILMVTRYDSSLENQLAHAIKQFSKANVQVDGIVINDMQQGLMNKYSYNYNYAYGDVK